MPKDGDLHKAAYKGDAGECEDLIDNGADVNEAGAQDRTALHRAVAGKHAHVVKLLISKGANVNAVDVAGRTPMHWAGIVGSTECARALFEANGNFNDQTKDNLSTPLHMAAESGFVEFCQYAVTTGQADKTRKNVQGQTAYDVAKKAGKKEVLSTLKLPGGGGCSIL